MASFFKKHKSTPAELATKLGNALNTLAEGGDDKVRRFTRPEGFALDRRDEPGRFPRERGSTAR